MLFFCVYLFLTTEVRLANTLLRHYMFYSFTLFDFFEMFYLNVVLAGVEGDGELVRHYCEANDNNSVNQCLLVMSVIQPERRFSPGLVNTRRCY